MSYLSTCTYILMIKNSLVENFPVPHHSPTSGLLSHFQFSPDTGGNSSSSSQ